MIIKPKIDCYVCGFTDIEKDELQLSFVNIRFREFYRNIVFTNYKQLEDISYDSIDVVIFTGFAGAGHFSAAYAIAKQLQKDKKNVIIVDLFAMSLNKIAFLADKFWRFVSRYAQDLFVYFCDKVSSTKGLEQNYFFMKNANIEPMKKFIEEKQVKVLLSTYIFPSVIMSRFKDVCPNLGVIATDHSAVGMLGELYKDISCISLFVPSVDVYKSAKNMYHHHPTSDYKELIILGSVPCMITKEVNKKLGEKKIKGLLTYFVGGGIGIGYGIKFVPKLIEQYEGEIIIVCGDNKRWKNSVNKFLNTRPDFKNRVTVLGYVIPEIAIQLMQISEIVLAKAGGITSSELNSLENSIKIFIGSIKGHEEIQAQLFHELGYATKCDSIENVLKTIKKNEKNESFLNEPGKEPAIQIISNWVQNTI